jgi:hypothetical protein
MDLILAKIYFCLLFNLQFFHRVIKNLLNILLINFFQVLISLILYHQINYEELSMVHFNQIKFL